MECEIMGDALKVLEDFIKYAELEPDVMSEVMYYDTDEFMRRVKYLKKALQNKSR